MPTVSEFINQIRVLPSQDQQQLLKELQALVGQQTTEQSETTEGPYAHSLALAGTLHTSSSLDVAVDKYKHLADAYADKHEDQ
jgi:hypothetical protein